MKANQTERIGRLLAEQTSAPDAREALEHAAAGVEWESSGMSVSTKEILDTYERRARLAEGACGPNLGRPGNWAAFLPALRSIPVERVALHWAHFPTGHFALAVTDEPLSTLFTVLVLVPDLRNRKREPWMGRSEE